MIRRLVRRDHPERHILPAAPLNLRAPAPLAVAFGRVPRCASCVATSRYPEGVSALTFNVIYEDAGEGWVYAHVPELPEVQTQGADLDDARAMVKDAITLVLEERRARGEAIPQTGWALVEAIEIAA